MLVRLYETFLTFSYKSKLIGTLLKESFRLIVTSYFVVFPRIKFILKQNRVS